MTTPITPLVLIFDLDETMFSTKLWDEPTRSLSESAENILSKSSDGQVLNPVMMSNEEQEFRVERVTALNRRIMKLIFEKIHQVIEKAKQQNIESPIAVKIITAATYHEPHIKKLFDAFYAENRALFTKEEIPIEYFNVFDFDDLGPIDSKQTKSEKIDPRKADLIFKKFKEWKEQMPGLTRDRVILIDNADYNIEAVKGLGFEALHYATTPEDRLDDKKFRKMGTQVITKLSTLIDDIDRSLSSSASKVTEASKSRRMPPPIPPRALKPKPRRPLPILPSKKQEQHEITPTQRKEVNRKIEESLKSLASIDVFDPKFDEIIKEIDRSFKSLQNTDSKENQ